MIFIITMFLLDIGQSVTKSIVMGDQGNCGIGSGMSLPAGGVWGTLACMQAVQDEMDLWISMTMLSHQ